MNLLDREISGDFLLPESLCRGSTLRAASCRGKKNVNYHMDRHDDTRWVCTPYTYSILRTSYTDRDGPYSVGEIGSGVSGEKREKKGLVFHFGSA